MNIGVDSIKKFKDHYREHIYHQPADNYDPENFSLSGIQHDAQLMFQVGYTLSKEDYFPKWYENSEFKAVREDD